MDTLLVVLPVRLYGTGHCNTLCRHKMDNVHGLVPDAGWPAECRAPGRGGSAVFVTREDGQCLGQQGWMKRCLYEAIDNLRTQGLRIELRVHGRSKLEVLIYGRPHNDWPIVEAAIKGFVSTEEARRNLAEARLRMAPDRLQESVRDACGICLQEVRPANAANQDAVCITPCMHMFHRSCIISSLRVQPRCPYCRQNVQVCQLSTVSMPPALADVDALSLQPAAKKRRGETALWTRAEEAALMQLHAAHGNSWKHISQQFNFGGKTPAQLKDKFRNLSMSEEYAK